MVRTQGVLVYLSNLQRFKEVQIHKGPYSKNMRVLTNQLDHTFNILTTNSIKDSTSHDIWSANYIGFL